MGAQMNAAPASVLFNVVVSPESQLVTFILAILTHFLWLMCESYDTTRVLSD